MAAVAAVATLTTVSPAVSSAAALAWEPCPDRAGFDCAVLNRPISVKQPGLGTFGMALVRHRATDPSRRIGVLVVNPGGPGQSGVDFTFAVEQKFSPEVRARFDVVGFDPRGVGLSQPVRCSAEVLFGGPTTHPADKAGFDALVKHGKELREDCARRSGPIIDHVSTDEVVADVDALRRALKESRISYYGLSYGTVIGQRLAELHGAHVRAMVLDSVVNRGVNARAHVASVARAAADSFEQWRRWNERTASSPLHGKDVVALWDELMAKAARGELVAPDDPDRRLTVHDLSNTVTSLASVPDWAELSARVHAMHMGGVVPHATAGDDTFLFPMAATAIRCADRGFRVRAFAEYRALTRLENRISPHTDGSLRGNLAMTECLGGPDARLPQRPGVMRTELPALLLNSRHDPATPHDEAMSVRRRQRDATVFVTYEGAGHGVYNRSECTRRVSDRYLVSLELPADGSSCPSADR
ncbi:alpha/beta fold hydrolase [Lentzea sp. NBRC 102530]|uniref:alpha/beta fold hydrolase n=1 Tax=Lentzea sp. NBRC 102530 TaxID=3032201 RepID=UPI0025555BEB|nr:alpha/beta fold hydrolase [Lentzea sp. NBRC 102530]